MSHGELHLVLRERLNGQFEHAAPFDLFQSEGLIDQSFDDVEDDYEFQQMLAELGVK